MSSRRLLAYSIPQYVVALSVALLRCWVRLKIVKSFGRDDWVMISALVPTTACFLSYMTEVSLGLGSRVDILKANMSNYHKLLLTRLLHQVFVVVALGLVKVSVCLFLLRLVMKKLYIRALWGIIIFIVVFTIGSVLSIHGILPSLYIFLKHDWYFRFSSVFPSQQDGTILCVHRHSVLATQSVTASARFVRLDSSTEMVRRARFTLVAVLSVGILAAIAGIIRQVSVGPLDEYGAYSIWNFTELHLGIIAASLPALKPIFKKFIETIGTNIARTPRYGPSNSIIMSPLGNTAAAKRGWEIEDNSDVFMLCPPDNIRVTSVVQVHQGWSRP
ncbi:hypothetical protein PSV08DRAFT_248054 [Bipolaris maydis]|uniref:uncharacterized protein n=1 Tax=Cochliobolus heterostrophus TaxID=5016 RepID=UPI0024DCE288|nr:hypothetical protein J3E73DRAFT_257681 [Bipolaris maydis]KAJ6270302.1 hypothetical protein PSV08DRAFT_248054 [Bipolaris maydis]